MSEQHRGVGRCQLVLHFHRYQGLVLTDEDGEAFKEHAKRP